MACVRTNVEIDDDLLDQARALAGTKTKRETIDFALRELIRRRQAKDILELFGKVEWEGDLDALRASRF